MKRLALVVALLVAFVLPAFAQAQQAVPGPEKPLKFATGNPKLTYSQMYATLAAFCPKVEEYTATTGGIDNLDLLVTNKVALGIVPEDVLALSLRTDPNVKQNIKALVGLHYNALHIIVLKDGATTSKGGGFLSKFGFGKEEKMIIRDLRDLKDKTIAAFGSSYATADLICDRLRMNMDIKRVKKLEEGLDMLRSGQAVAMFATAGWPADFVSKLDPKLYTLVSLDEGVQKTLGEPFKSLKLNYLHLECMGVSTVGARNVVAVWNYTGKKKVQQIVDFKDCLLANLQDIQESDESHPSWKDVNPKDFTWFPFEPK